MIAKKDPYHHRVTLHNGSLVLEVRVFFRTSIHWRERLEVHQVQVSYYRVKEDGNKVTRKFPAIKLDGNNYLAYLNLIQSLCPDNTHWSFKQLIENIDSDMIERQRLMIEYMERQNEF